MTRRRGNDGWQTFKDTANRFRLPQIKDTPMNIEHAFPSNNLKAADLNGKAVRVTIDHVTIEKMGDEQKPILHFVGKEKGLVLNRTNANRIVEATGSYETEAWSGWSILIFPTKVDFQGKRVDAIRVDDRPGSSRAPVKFQGGPVKQAGGRPVIGAGGIDSAQQKPHIADEAFTEHVPQEEVTEDDIPF